MRFGGLRAVGGHLPVHLQFDFDTVAERCKVIFTERLRRANQVNLGHVVVRVRDATDHPSVGRKNEHPGGRFIQTTHGHHSILVSL